MNNYGDIIKLIIYCLEMYINCFFFYHVLTPKYSLKKTYPASCLGISAAAWLAYMNQANIFARQIIIFLAFFIICKILYQNTTGAVFFFICVSYALMVICDVTAVFSFHALAPEVKDYTKVGPFVLGNLLWMALYLLIINTFLIIWKRKKHIYLSKRIYLTALFPLCQFFIVNDINYFNILRMVSGSEHRWVMNCAVGSILCVVADMILFQVMLGESKKERLVARIEDMDDQNHRECDYYDLINQNIQEMRKIHHDFNNKLQTAYNIILKDQEEGKKAAALLLGQVEQQIEETSPVYYCSNLIVNIILEEKAREAKAQDISMDISVEFPEETVIKKSDLCSVFCNLLDNAIHAAVLTKGPRTITVNSWFRAGYCIIKVTNPFSDAGSRIAKERSDKMHGYGLSILNSIAEKYQGEFVTCTESGMFIANIKLKTGG